MKIVATYSGTVTKLCNHPEQSFVTLQEDGTDTIVQTMAVTEELIKRNIGQGDKFKVTIYESSDGKAIGELEKITL